MKIKKILQNRNKTCYELRTHDFQPDGDYLGFMKNFTCTKCGAFYRTSRDEPEIDFWNTEEFDED